MVMRWAHLLLAGVLEVVDGRLDLVRDVVVVAEVVVPAENDPRGAFLQFFGFLLRSTGFCTFFARPKGLAQKVEI